MSHNLFYFMRHGETEYNRQGIITGQTDIPLNDTGRQQARDAQHVVRNITIDRIYVSPLKRAHETAMIVNAHAQKEIVLAPELQEVLMGDREGKPHTGDTFKEWQEQRGDWEETKEAFIQRVGKGFEALSHPSLVVAHGVTYWALTQYLGVYGDLPTLHNARILKFQKVRDFWVIEALN